MELPEDTYGTRKRFRFIEAAVIASKPRRILDVGCGIGSVSLELARRFPDIEIVGVDVDQASIDHARTCAMPGNVQFLLAKELSQDERFDFVIASEVLEHVEKPMEFLRALRKSLLPGGRIVLTVPNGYGPFELLSLVQGILQITGVHGFLRKVKRLVSPPRGVPQGALVTHANSPHINFFSLTRLRRLITGAGFEVKTFQARTFLCGFLLDHCLRGQRAIQWNAEAADKLPPMLSSDWMFLLQTHGAPLAGEFEYAPGLYGRIHGYVNKRCAQQLASSVRT